MIDRASSTQVRNEKAKRLKAKKSQQKAKESAEKHKYKHHKKKEKLNKERRKNAKPKPKPEPKPKIVKVIKTVKEPKKEEPLWPKMKPVYLKESKKELNSASMMKKAAGSVIDSLQ